MNLDVVGMVLGNVPFEHAEIVAESFEIYEGGPHLAVPYCFVDDYKSTAKYWGAWAIVRL